MNDEQVRLTEDQRLKLLEMMAAERSREEIRGFFASQEGWPELKRSHFDSIIRDYGKEIKILRETRRSEAMTTGLANLEEMIQSLKDHAGELAKIMWVQDKSGRCPNERAWRETVDQIATLMGHKKQNLTVDGGVLLLWDGMKPESDGQTLQITPQSS